MNKFLSFSEARKRTICEQVTAHRQIYFRFTWVNYDTMRPGQLRLVPTEEQVALWKSDYTAMKDEMFFGKPPEFEEMIQTVRAFQDEFNTTV